MKYKISTIADAIENKIIDYRRDFHRYAETGWTEFRTSSLVARRLSDLGYEVMTGAAPLSMNPFGMIISQNEGLVEVVAEKKYGEVLGMHFIGQGACEMAGQAVLALQMEATLEDLTRVTFPHPTLSESVAEAARDALGIPIYLP